MVRFDGEGKWECECKLTDKTGLPCAHILKIVLLLRQPIRSTINPWWIRIEENQTKLKK